MAEKTSPSPVGSRDRLEGPYAPSQPRLTLLTDIISFGTHSPDQVRRHGMKLAPRISSAMGLSSATYHLHMAHLLRPKTCNKKSSRLVTTTPAAFPNCYGDQHIRCTDLGETIQPRKPCASSQSRKTLLSTSRKRYETLKHQIPPHRGGGCTSFKQLRGAPAD